MNKKDSRAVDDTVEGKGRNGKKSGSTRLKNSSTCPGSLGRLYTGALPRRKARAHFMVDTSSYEQLDGKLTPGMPAEGGAGGKPLLGRHPPTGHASHFLSFHLSLIDGVIFFPCPC